MKKPIYAALDLHSGHSVLGSMDHDGQTQPRMRFPTEASVLRAQVERLRRKRRPLYLTMEAGALSRWASGIVRPLVKRLIICEARHNRLINSNPTKSDEADVEGMCLLLRLGKLKEVWMGTDRTREIYRALVYELLNWRDAQRELKALIKARYRGWGVLRLHGIRVFSAKGREEYLAQLPAEEERRMMRRLYGQLDHALKQWKETLKEVERVGGAFWEVEQFQRIPGVGPIAAHVFSAIIEEPSRFPSKFKLWKYSQLGITERTSDNKPLGYQRLDRRGKAELKNLSYHAWRTACKSTTGPNAIKTFYQQSRLRTGSVRHARLNTQRKILEALWLIWLRHRPFDPEKFNPPTPAPLAEATVVRRTAAAGALLSRKKQEFAFRMTPDQSIGRACQLQASAGPFGVNAAPECHERLRFPMVILNRLARVPRTCITNAITPLAQTAQHALPAPKLSKPLLPS